jgi:hypothetical protein
MLFWGCFCWLCLRSAAAVTVPLSGLSQMRALVG